MITENCKKIKLVVVKLCSKTKCTTFSEHGVKFQFRLLSTFHNVLQAWIENNYEGTLNSVSVMAYPVRKLLST